MFMLETPHTKYKHKFVNVERLTMKTLLRKVKNKMLTIIEKLPRVACPAYPLHTQPCQGVIEEKGWIGRLKLIACGDALQ